MSFIQLRPRQASMVWLEPGRVHAGGQGHALSGPLTEERLLQALDTLPPGPSHWVVDDLWMPAVLMRDIVELPAGTEAKEAFFRWRYTQTLALEGPQYVQALALGENAWLLAGLPEGVREMWLRAAQTAGRPIRSLIPRWLWLYNRLAPTLEVPGLLLSLSAAGNGTYTGTLAAWGRHLTLLRQWSEPGTPEEWNQERILPTASYLQRDARSPQALHVWGASTWPECSLATRILPPEIPAQETC